MQMLVALHRAGGRVVSKDDLFKQCWDGRIVGDDAINRVISRLRHDAEHHAGNAFRVETITRVGYRLIADGLTAPADREMTSKDPTWSFAARRRVVLGGAAAAVMAAGAGIFGWNTFGGSGTSGEAKILVGESRSAMLEPTPEGISNTVAKLKRASQLAPDSAEVWGLLALAYRTQAANAPGSQRDPIMNRSLEAAHRALAIDNNNGDALAVLAWQSGFGQWSASEQAARRALVRAPQHPVLNRMLAVLLLEVGREGDALVYLDRSRRAEPMAVYTHMWRTTALWDLGRLDEAEAAIENAYRLWPRHYAIWFIRNSFLAYNGRAQEALAMIADVSSRPVGIPDWNFDIIRLQSRALATRDRVAIDQAMDAWVAAAGRGPGFAQNAIIFAGAMGRLDVAFEIIGAYYFDRGFTLGEHAYSREQGIYAIKNDRHTYFLFLRQLAPLRSDPRFKQLISEIGLDDYWAQSGTRPDYLG